MLDPKIEFQFTAESFTESTHTRLKVHWIVPSHLAYFEGHFPDKPILPAVAIIDASLEILRRGLGKKQDLEISTLASCKFTHPVIPHLPVEISLQLTTPLNWEVVWKTKPEPPETSIQLATLKLSLKDDRG